VQRFESVADLDRHHTTIEEREEYEQHIVNGVVVYAGVVSCGRVHILWLSCYVQCRLYMHRTKFEEEGEDKIQAAGCQCDGGVCRRGELSSCCSGMCSCSKALQCSTAGAAGVAPLHDCTAITSGRQQGRLGAANLARVVATGTAAAAAAAAAVLLFLLLIAGLCCNFEGSSG
jgi:hypothetical protein